MTTDVSQRILWRIESAEKRLCPARMVSNVKSTNRSHTKGFWASYFSKRAVRGISAFIIQNASPHRQNQRLLPFCAAFNESIQTCLEEPCAAADGDTLQSPGAELRHHPIQMRSAHAQSSGGFADSKQPLAHSFSPRSSSSFETSSSEISCGMGS